MRFRQRTRMNSSGAILLLRWSMRASSCVAVLMVFTLAGWTRAEPGENAPGEQAVIPITRSARFATDGDVESLLRRADDLLAAAQYRDALTVLDHVLQRTPDALVMRADGRVVPARLAVEQVLLDLPEAALQTHRLTADAQVRAIVGDDPFDCRNPFVLQRAFDRHFVSALGDQVGYQLALLKLDRLHFAEARRVLLKVLHHHPDLRHAVDAEARAMSSRIHLRLALCEIRMGRPQRARGHLDQWEASQREEQQLGEWIRREITNGLPADSSEESAGSTEISIRSAGAADDSLWLSAWHVRLATVSDMHGGASGPQVAALAGERLSLLQRWRERHWLPAVEGTWSADGLLITNCAGILTCIDPTSDAVRWRGSDAVSTRLLLGEMTARPEVRQINRATTRTNLERLMFMDHRSAAVRIVGDVVYHAAPTGGVMGQLGRRSMRPQAFSTAVVARRIRDGEAIWRQIIRIAPNGGEAAAMPAQPLAMPLRIGDHLLLPVELENEVWLVALEPKDGRIAWTRYLCSKTARDDSPFAQVAMIEHERQLLLAGDWGYVIAVDPHDGAVQWASAYRAADDAPYEPILRNSVMIPRLDHLLVQPIDSATLLLVDAVDGQVVDQLALEDPRCLVPAGSDILLCEGQSVSWITIRNDRLVRHWRTDMISLTGAPVVVGEAVFVPQADHIVRLDRADGSVEARIEASTESGEPVGNLHSDGRHLLSLGMDTLHAMVDAPQAIRRLGRSVLAGDIHALQRRVDLHLLRDDLAAAADDLRVLHRLNLETPDETAEIASQLFDVLIALAARDKTNAEKLISEAAPLVRTDSQHERLTLIRAGAANAAGRLDEALRAYGQLALDGRTMLALTESGVLAGPTFRFAKPPACQVWSRSLGREALQRLVEQRGTVAASLVEAHAQVALAQMGDTSTLGLETDPFEVAGTLRNLAMAYPRTRAALAAVRRLVAMAIRDEAPLLSAEATAQEIARCAETPNAAAALAELAKLYESRQWYDQAMEQWTALRVDWPHARIEWEGEHISAEELAALRIESLHGRAEESGHVGFGRTWRHWSPPPWQLLWQYQSGGTYLVEPMLISGIFPQLLRDGALFYSAGWERLTLRNVVDREPMAASVALPDKLSGALGFSRIAGPVLRGGVEGQLLVIRGRDALGAIGLDEGRLVWQRDMPTLSAMSPEQLNAAKQHLPRRFDLREGVWAEIIPGVDQSGDVVRVVSTIDGQTFWQRSIDDHRLSAVGVVDSAVHIVTAERKVISCDTHSGAVINRIDRRHDGLVGLRITEAGLIDNIETHTVIMRRWSDGTPQWQARLDGRLHHVRMIGNGVLIALHEAARIPGKPPQPAMSLIDLATGTIRWTAPYASDLTARFHDLALSPDGQSLVCWSRDEGQWVLTIHNAGNGKRLRTIPCGQWAAVHISAQTLAACGPIVPQFERDQHEPLMTRIVFHDMAKGERRDEMQLPLPDDEKLIRGLRQPPIIRNGVMMVVSEDGIMAFGNRNWMRARAMTAQSQSSAGHRNDE